MLRVLDLFSGIGGFSLGLERTGGFKTVAFCEINPFCRRVLAKHWPAVPCYEDIRALTAERLGADGIAVDAICGGFPCQPFSSASRGRKTAPDLWPDMLRLIRELRPGYVIGENVQAAPVTRAAEALRSIGYRTDCRCISAAHAGADHSRDRWWISAHTDSKSELHRSLNAEMAKLPALCRGLWGPENYSLAIRVPDGLPDRLDRPAVEAIGNAVVPQIPEIIGRAILAAQSPSSHASLERKENE